MGKKTTLYGIDGCPGGWLVTSLKTGAKRPTVALHETLREVLSSTRKKDIVCIDIPIGLPEEAMDDTSKRLCDTQARALLGRKGSSIFPAPTRGILEFIDDYDVANQWSRDQCGRGLTRQTFNILPKIKEVDDLVLSGKAKARIYETHPELSFACKNGSNKKPKPVSEKKSTIEGQIMRLKLLPKPWRKLADQSVAILGPKSITVDRKSRKLWAIDDLIDSLACLNTARRISGAGGGKPLKSPHTKKPPRDAYHLPMQIIA